eukprot:2802730-Rhodomonas_salina.1
MTVYKGHVYTFGGIRGTGGRGSGEARSTDVVLSSVLRNALFWATIACHESRYGYCAGELWRGERGEGRDNLTAFTQPFCALPEQQCIAWRVARVVCRAAESLLLSWPDSPPCHGSTEAGQNSAPPSTAVQSTVTTTTTFSTPTSRESDWSFASAAQRDDLGYSASAAFPTSVATVHSATPAHLTSSVLPLASPPPPQGMTSSSSSSSSSASQHPIPATPMSGHSHKAESSIGITAHLLPTSSPSSTAPSLSPQEMSTSSSLQPLGSTHSTPEPAKVELAFSCILDVSEEQFRALQLLEVYASAVQSVWGLSRQAISVGEVLEVQRRGALRGLHVPTTVVSSRDPATSRTVLESRLPAALRKAGIEFLGFGGWTPDVESSVAGTPRSDGGARSSDNVSLLAVSISCVFVTVLVCAAVALCPLLRARCYAVLGGGQEGQGQRREEVEEVELVVVGEAGAESSVVGEVDAA